MNIKEFLSKHIKTALIHSGAPINSNPLITTSTKTNRGHYQINGIIKIAKLLNITPVSLAKKVKSNLNLDDILNKIEISNQGFLNIFLNPQWIQKQLEKIINCPRLGIEKTKKPQKIIIDYSSPNIAKEMHIGHLRSTILGDSMAKIMQLYGHQVTRVNHIGDWGTQFGMLLSYLNQEKEHETIPKIQLKNLEQYYKKSKIMYDTNASFAKLSRQYVVRLQNKEKKIYSIWKQIVRLTILENEKIYKMLNTTLRTQDIKGESFYHNMVPGIIEDLKNKNLITEQNGSLIVLLDTIKNKQNNIMGIVIQKKDGAYLYASTDIACIKYRCQILHADQILYFIDNRQIQYLKNILEISKKANYINNHIKIKHYHFGMILSKNHKPFKTRSGNTIKLLDLLQESISRTKKIVRNKNPQLSKEKIETISKKIGIGSIKYSDLSKKRTHDYIFDWDQMLSLEGNTALYIQYTYTRIISVLEKNKTSIFKLPNKIYLTYDLEIKLGVKILQFNEIIQHVSNVGYIHLICNYLYELSVIYSSFYEQYSILFEQKEHIKITRIKLSLLTAKTIKKGLYLLGIRTISYL
ncbi:MAG: arginine--tRNA ligase [Buchnera aphidicola (Eriosoma harunire)]